MEIVTRDFKIGDWVEVAIGGNTTLAEPKRIHKIEPGSDGKLYYLLEGENAGVKAKDLKLIEFASLPDISVFRKMRAKPQWVSWKYEKRTTINGETYMAKVLVCPNGNYNASVNKPKTWGLYDAAIANTVQSRDLMEDLSVHPDGIKDFGVHDLGELEEAVKPGKPGGRTAIDLVIEYGPNAVEHDDGCIKTPTTAALWLRRVMGIAPAAPGWDDGDKPSWMVALAEKLWGPATRRGKEYRFGIDQKKVIDVRGMWFDFNTNRGGGIQDLMRMVKMADRGQAGNAVMVCAAEVKMRPLDWLWPGHLLRGSPELISGMPDLGKSQVHCCYVACATNRLTWPDGAPPIEPVNVIMMTAEDTLDQILVPRLVAAGADLSRVCIKTDEHDRQFLLAEDLHELERAMEDFGNVGLFTIDPITAFMGGKMDSHKATEVRSQLGPLKDLAERRNAAGSLT